MNKKRLVIGIVGVLILGSGLVSYKHFTTKPTETSFNTAQAKFGNVEKVITATGTVNYPHAITLTFPKSDNSSTAGKIVELNVQAGDTVKAGQVLAKIDETKLQTDVLQAQANVTTAESKLLTLKDSFNDSTRAEAEATLAKAEENLTTAQQNADPTYLALQVTLADENVKQASDNLAKAQQSGETSSIQSAQTALNQAMNSLTSAKNLQNGGAAQALAAAHADVVSAQYEVDQQAKGPVAADIQAAQADIQIAQAQLTSAQADLKDAAIIAPVEAVVISCPLELGQDSDSDSIITLTPVGDKLEVEASIDQADIAQCQVGQKVDITLDAYPNNHISGTVNAVSLQGSTTDNVTTYSVTATVDQNSELLRAGMNANVNIIVATANNVLTVPCEAIKTEGSQTGVTVTANTNTENKSNAVAQEQFVPVEIGLDDGTNVEIKSGLKEGQEVITGTKSTATTTTSNSGSGLNLGGIGGPDHGNGGPPPN